MNREVKIRDEEIGDEGMKWRKGEGENRRRGLCHPQCQLTVIAVISRQRK